MTPKERTGILFLLLTAGGYALLPIFIKFAYEANVQPLDLLIWRFMLAAPLIWLLVGLSGRRNAAKAPQQKKLPALKLLLVGMLFGAAALTAFFSLQRIQASTYTVLLYAYPAFVAILLLFLGEPLSGRGWIALALTLIGVLLTVPNLAEVFGSGDALGYLMALANGTQYAIYIVISSRLLRGQTELVTASALSITGTLILMLMLALTRGLQVPTEPGVWLIFLGLVTISTVMPIFCFYEGMQRVGAGQAAILSTLEPVLVLILSFVLLHETMTIIQIFGGVLILTSAILLQIKRPAAVKKPVAQAAGD